MLNGKIVDASDEKKIKGEDGEAREQKELNSKQPLAAWGRIHRSDKLLWGTYCSQRRHGDFPNQ